MTEDDLLSDDHADIDRLFERALAALEAGRDASAIVDLLWARLAVHIRAEHLHLFPFINAIALKMGSLETAEAIRKLRDDHDFFMKKFASIVKDLRRGITEDLVPALNEIVGRLSKHNSLEEDQIYPLVREWLNQEEMDGLQKLISAELNNAPPRFSRALWRPER